MVYDSQLEEKGMQKRKPEMLLQPEQAEHN